MGYRGEDLDLRTPQGLGPVHDSIWRESDGLRDRTQHGGRLNGPIIVDETVLACCNHAYDIALAHGASEVRMEHFLNALTRIDAAADALEAHGVRVAALRRESATIIASEIPSASAKTTGSPRRTQELEDVLRLAAARAADRDTAATVNDLVQVMIEDRTDLPGLAMLAAVTVRTPRRTYESKQVPRLSERNYLNDSMRSRYRLTAPNYLTPENGNGQASNGRLDSLEHNIASLVADISADRNAVAGALQQLQNEAYAQREELIQGFNALSQAIHSHRADSIDLTPIQDRVASIGRETSGKLATLENVMDRLISKPNNDLSIIEKRLEAIEDVVTGNGTSISDELEDRLNQLEEKLIHAQARATEQHDGVLRELSQVNGRMEHHRNEVIGGVLTPLAERDERQRGELQSLLQPVAERIESQRSEIATAILSPLAERIDRLEKLSQSADGHEARTSQALTGVVDRVTHLERSIDEWGVSVTQTGEAYSKELDEIEQVLIKLCGDQNNMSEAFAAWRQEGTNMGSAMIARLDTVEQQGARANTMLEQMATIVERLHNITARRYLRRNRMKYWLFGTDDWISASWPSQANRISDALGNITIARD